jgi:hypothetical protein
MSADELEQPESGVETPDPEDVPVFEGQVMFKRDYSTEIDAGYDTDDE